MLKYDIQRSDAQNIPKLKNTLVVINKGNCMVRPDLDDCVIKYSSQVISCPLSTCSMEVHMQRHVKKCTLQKDVFKKKIGYISLFVVEEYLREKKRKFYSLLL